MDTQTICNAIRHVGGQAEMARRIDVPVAMVWQWSKGLRPIPSKHCIPIERATNGAVTRYDLRPDVFGDAPASNEPIQSSKPRRQPKAA